jgi:hypothetical protein
MLGVYYLHENGKLISKPAACFANTSVGEYMDSPFVRKYWIMPKNAPVPGLEGQKNWMLNWLREAYELGAKPEEIKRICDANGLDCEAILEETKEERI